MNQSHNYNGNENEKLLRLVTTFSVLTAILLISIKTIGWNLTGSVSILSSLMDSFLDLLISGINFIAIRYALKPADEDHKFGHGKAEDIAAIFQAAFIAGLSILIAIEAISRFAKPQMVAHTDVGIIIMTISLFFTITLVSFQIYVFKKTKSNLVEADSVHYISDVMTNIAIIASLFITSHFQFIYFDTIVGLLIAAYIFREGLKIGKSAFDKLMDKELDEETIEKIREIITAHPEVIKLSNLKTRYAGATPFIQFEFTMDGRKTLKKSHGIAHEIEDSLLAEFPDAEIFIHQEPEE
ncbi:MAG: divalent metal cation transporter FieF [Alphaproteobacteria bacterium CG11_big_fil_rev_8_21_14_0_20_44_7]|nr:MAG: divalent metal cation transporter FieF [Alphaproteobacteria bacterium CG11_big_fil_rev_8_21_14_0_20_44_7]